MDLMEKLAILGESARYDVSCSTSGVARANSGKGVGNASLGGICHTWTEDGRCVSLLKVLMSNQCCYDCAYCINRRSNDRPRASFEPKELADLTMAFYRRNYIEGLFLSSGVLVSPDHTVERMVRTLRLLRHTHRFRGYIHAKAIPGTSAGLLEQLGLLADRVSVNIEQCTAAGLRLLAPQKTERSIATPMRFLAGRQAAGREELARFRHAPAFIPAGQSTQVIVGASPERDRQILTFSQRLYQQFMLKRVYYSAYVPVNDDARLPALVQPPPLLREHRLYQADWLLRFYHFDVSELFLPEQADLDLEMDPKCAWALSHLDLFPIELNKADFETLLRVPGIGVRSARKIVAARRRQRLRLEDLKPFNLVMKRAGWFITCDGRYGAARFPSAAALRLLLADTAGRQRQSPLQIGLEDLGYVCQP
ncbi:MAG: putative DNA modification/repair radical SAM protein [Ruminococcaceae bacterium]|nr:putative DNA modification/repair radical SAM protein [Oscillospiraceae bacterium]